MEKIVLEKLPKTLDEMKSLRQADLSTPFQTASLFVAAISNYAHDPKATYEMISYLKGPGGELTDSDKSWLKNRLSDKKYFGFAYFKGSTPENNYQPSTPYTIEFSENDYSYSEKNYAKIFIHGVGFDSARPITLRLKPSAGRWFLWEYSSIIRY